MFTTGGGQDLQCHPKTTQVKLSG
uniref:Uncharacterized protein n=1 Tax=Anguilla anguilla TaxID=7936 RepID=A0A0E9R9P8_ANGAN